MKIVRQDTRAKSLRCCGKMLQMEQLPLNDLRKLRAWTMNNEVIEKLSIIIELQEQLIVRLCNQVSQDESIDEELRRIEALKAELNNAV